MPLMTNSDTWQTGEFFPDLLVRIKLIPMIEYRYLFFLVLSAYRYYIFNVMQIIYIDLKIKINIS